PCSSPCDCPAGSRARSPRRIASRRRPLPRRAGRIRSAISEIGTNSTRTRPIASVVKRDGRPRGTRGGPSRGIEAGPMDEESLFAAVLERTSPADRRALLDAACAGDEALRRRMESLLAAHAKTLGILDQPASPPGDTGPPAGASLPGGRPGTAVADRYTLIEPIGEGGMGTVWMAEQTWPVRRKV